jgi:hypothetical protein
VTSHRPARALACAGGLLFATAALPTTPAAAKSPTDYARLVDASSSFDLSQMQIDRFRRSLRARKHVSRRARLTKRGHAIAPAGAPKAVRRIIRAGNRIAQKPYLWGGGHGAWQSSGYDCSGSVSYALHGAKLLNRAVASGGLTGFGKAGKGRWVTIYANGGHVYMIVAGLRFDTTAFKQGGSRWSRDLRGGGGFVLRHPRGL